jgi:hypothetical protein
MIDNDDKLDLSALDPQRDRARWEALVRSITRRALAGRERPGLFFGLVNFARPALVFALGLTVVVWTGALVSRRSAGVYPTQDPAMSLLSWASAETMPEPGDILATFGGYDDSGH